MRNQFTVGGAASTSTKILRNRSISRSINGSQASVYRNVPTAGTSFRVNSVPRALLPDSSIRWSLTRLASTVPAGDTRSLQISGLKSLDPERVLLGFAGAIRIVRRVKYRKDWLLR